MLPGDAMSLSAGGYRIGDENETGGSAANRAVADNRAAMRAKVLSVVLFIVAILFAHGPET
jgi:hypothetical protein